MTSWIFLEERLLHRIYIYKENSVKKTLASKKSKEISIDGIKLVIEIDGDVYEANVKSIEQAIKIYNDSRNNWEDQVGYRGNFEDFGFGKIFSAKKLIAMIAPNGNIIKGAELVKFSNPNKRKKLNPEGFDLQKYKDALEAKFGTDGVEAIQKYLPNMLNQYNVEELLAEYYNVTELPCDAQFQTVAWIEGNKENGFRVCISDNDAEATYGKSFKTLTKAQDEILSLGESSSLIDLGGRLKKYTI